MSHGKNSGFFKVNRYDKPGPGIDKDQPEKKRFFLFWELFARKFWKLITLSLLYTVCCIPIVTIGPATSGLMYVVRNFSQQEPSFIASDFFDAFKKNWKQSFVMSVINLVGIILVSVSVPFYYAAMQSSSFMIVPLAFSVSAGLILLMMNYYMHLMIVSLTLNMKQMLKNAFLLSVAAIKTNIITTLIIAVFAVLAYLSFPYMTIIYLFFMAIIGFAFVAFVVAFNSYQYILKYVVEPFYAKQGRVKPLDEDNNENERIFTDIGTKEVPVEVDHPKKGSNKTIS